MRRAVNERESCFDFIGAGPSMTQAFGFITGSFILGNLPAIVNAADEAHPNPVAGAQLPVLDPAQFLPTDLSFLERYSFGNYC